MLRRRLAAVSLALALSIALALVSSSPAQACGRGMSWVSKSELTEILLISLGSAVFVVGDVAMTGYDVSKGVKGEHVSTGYAVGEMLFTAPQIAMVLAIPVLRNELWGLVVLPAFPFAHGTTSLLVKKKDDPATTSSALAGLTILARF